MLHGATLATTCKYMVILHMTGPCQPLDDISVKLVLHVGFPSAMAWDNSPAGSVSVISIAVLGKARKSKTPSCGAFMFTKTVSLTTCLRTDTLYVFRRLPRNTSYPIRCLGSRTDQLPTCTRQAAFRKQDLFRSLTGQSRR